MSQRPMTAAHAADRKGQSSDVFAKRKPTHRSAAKKEANADDKIEQMCKSIEERISSAARRRDNNLQSI